MCVKWIEKSCIFNWWSDCESSFTINKKFWVFWDFNLITVLAVYWNIYIFLYLIHQKSILKCFESIMLRRTWFLDQCESWICQREINFEIFAFLNVGMKSKYVVSFDLFISLHLSYYIILGILLISEHSIKYFGDIWAINRRNRSHSFRIIDSCVHLIKYLYLVSKLSQLWVT